MIKFLVGKKKEMTQVFNEEGRVSPVTIIDVLSPLTITQIKKKSTDGYCALQLGFEKTTEKHVAKPQRGHSKKAGENLFAHFIEIKIPEDQVEAYKVGDVFDSSVFAEGDMVVVSGISKGKGFQGGVKRYGFKGGRRTHGQKHSEREPGSIGAGGLQRVLKGTRMAGRMGSDKVTIKNLRIVGVSADSVAVKGAVPGVRGGYITLSGMIS